MPQIGALVVDGIVRLLGLVADMKTRARQLGLLTPEQEAQVEAEEVRVYGWADRPAPPPPASLNAGLEGGVPR